MAARMEIAEWGREKAVHVLETHRMLSVLQEAQQSQSVHSRFEHRCAKTGQFCSTLDGAVGEADNQLSEMTVKER